MLAQAQQPSRLVQLIESAKMNLTASQRWLLGTLGLALVWPWLMVLLWVVAAPAVAEWTSLWRTCFWSGIALWALPLAIAGWGVLKHRQNGVVYPMAIYALAWAEVAVIGGFAMFGMLFKVSAPMHVS